MLSIPKTISRAASMKKAIQIFGSESISIGFSAIVKGVEFSVFA
jgi:hypothetical protein